MSLDTLKRLEELTAQLGEQELIVKAFFDLARDCMVIYDSTSGRIVRVNKTWTDMFGYTSEEMQGMPYDQLVHPEDAERTRERVQARMRGELDGDSAFRNRYVAKDGSVHTLEWRGSPPHAGLIFAVARPC